MKFNGTGIYKLSDVIQVNPRESLKKGTLAKKVTMDKTLPFSRKIIGYENAPYNGGSKFRNKDTILARISPCLENGKMAYIDFLETGEVAFGSTEFIVLRAVEGITDPDYVYYLAASSYIRNPSIKSLVGTSGRQRVQTSFLKDIKVHLPSLEAQKKIAYILKTIDDKILVNERINKNL